MAAGYVGKILFVDLSNTKIWEETPSESLYKDFLGGYGLGSRIIFSQQKAKVDPLGPDAILGLVTGLLTGTPALFGSRYVVVGKSPLTNTWGDANSGGDFGPYLKFAGYDAVFFTGISSVPVYLAIDNGKPGLRKAEHLWGKDTNETEAVIEREVGRETRVASIGPAGEKLSLISCIINNRGRAAGRSGLGAVMGSKRLKAVAVRGEGQVPLANPTELEAARKRHLGQLGGASKIFREFGTCSGLAYLVQIGDTPVKNWGGSAMDFPAAAAISDRSVINLQERRYGCWHCPVACGGLMKASSGQYCYTAGAHKPEYETLASFGSLCLNDNLGSIIELNDICNRYGLDTISAGATVAFAIECSEKGIITQKDTEGIELRWGNHRAIVETTQRIAKREGIGEILADGVRHAAERLGKGAEEFAVHIHGQEAPMHDPKRTTYYATAYLDATPGRHTQGSYGTKPASGLQFPPFDRQTMAGRGTANKMGSDLMHVVNCTGLCSFGLGFMDASALPEFVNLATGWNLTINDLLSTGERIANMRQAFNIREGIRVADFKMPNRVIGIPAQEVGPNTGKTVEIQTLCNDYMVARDWDTTSGMPSKKKLLELGLQDVSDILWGK
ncbi:MAG: aldehyde ferredoxin oxidoreductase family protein [Chloroflexi bacterium]|nr:aldehyde ferredoxin oxidoreductase family protein [Chloroflexota bacterium]